MKTIIQVLKIGVVAFAAMMPVACLREIEYVDTDLRIERELTVEAAWGDASGTRTAIQEDGLTVLWTPAEEINLFQGASASGHFTSTNTEPARKIQFEGILVGQSDLSAPYWAIYPYNEGNTCSGSSVTMTVSSRQSASEGTFADKFFPAVAKSEDLQMKFYNVCGGALFSVVHEGITSVEFKSNGEEPLAGKVTVSMDGDGYPAIDEIAEGSSTVTVSLPDGAAFEVGKVYYAVFLPGKLSQGLKITYRTASSSATLIHDQALTVNRSRFGVLTNKDEGLEFEGGSSYSVETPEAVDLGLSVKWASFNLGATKPEEYGDYFAWGEIEPKTDYIVASYKWCMGSITTLTKYCLNADQGYNGFTDGKAVLDPEDDAAYVNLGSNWRMPTYAEMTELRNNCTWEWTTQNGVNGSVVTGPNGNSIFLPAAGLYTQDFFLLDEYGLYWSSSLSEFISYYALDLSFRSDLVGWGSNDRYQGRSIRPVCDDSASAEIKDRILYQSTDGKIVTPNAPNAFGANILSNEYKDGQGIISFDAKITDFGSEAFLGCSTLLSIIVPEGIKNIGFGAFAGCQELASIVLPDGLNAIRAHAFESCAKLERVDIPESVTLIDNRSFQFCGALKEIIIPQKVTSIGVEAFIACESLTSIIVASGNTIYDSREGCNAIIETESNTLITGCRNTIIPKSITGIKDHAFYASRYLNSITIPEKVVSIGERAFAHCYGLESITIPKSVERIASRAFETCLSLVRMDILTSIPPSIESDMLSSSNSCWIYVPSEAVELYKNSSGWSTYANRIAGRDVDTVPVPEAVDLGLSVKWASFNLGASKPEEYGDYYAWGETEPYYSSLDPLIWKPGKEAGYDWSSYKWRDGSTMTKYKNGSSPSGVSETLELEDDAAHVAFGGNWRMPTLEEEQELVAQCTWEWISMNGVDGLKATGPNGSSIFLPASGCINKLDFEEAGTWGSCWSSSIGRYNTYGKSLSIRSTKAGCYDNDRCLGLSIRPVYDDSGSSSEENLVAYYPFNGNADDASGHGNHGVLSGPNVPVLTTDRFGTANSAYEFGGYNNYNWIRVPNSESLVFDKEFTVSYWIQLAEFAGMNGWGEYSTDPGFAPFCKAGDGNATYPGLYFYLCKGEDGQGMRIESTNTNGNVRYDSNVNHRLAYTKSDYQPGDWLHIVLVVRDAEKILYVNGAEATRDELNRPADFSSMNSHDLYIGIMGGTTMALAGWGALEGGWYPFYGKIDDIKIYNCALDAQRVAQL